MGDPTDNPVSPEPASPVEAGGTVEVAAKDTERREVNPVSRDVVDRVLAVTGAMNVPEGRREQLARVLGQIDLRDTSVQIEKNDLVLTIAVRQLNEWGYSAIKPIDGGSLKIESRTDEEAAKINELVTSSKLPFLSYASNVGIYNFETTVGTDGKLVFRKTASNSLMDGFENVLRKSGDLGGNILSCLFSAGKRHKATAEEISKNIQELGLSDTFMVEGTGPDVSIKENIDDLKTGACLDDLLRMQDRVDFLKKFDQQEALKKAVEMIDAVHKRSGRGIGEVLANDIVMQVQNGELTGVRLALPDMRYSDDVPVADQKAHDLLDLCFSVGSAGLQAGGKDKGTDMATANIQTVLNNYSDTAVKNRMIEFTAAGIPQNTLHNSVRLGFDRVENKDQEFENIRRIIGARL